MTVAYITHPDCALHDVGGGHPERPARLTAIQDALVASGLDVVLRHFDAPKATAEQLARVHAPAYLDYLASQVIGEEVIALDPDTAMGPGSHRAALRAAGAVIHGVDLVMNGETDRAFCAVRPPGHHAERARAMGFCLLNNIAVGMAHALAVHGVERIAVVDFDVHHGNGTEQIFRDEPRVMLCSSFQHPFYPYTGVESQGENILNVPLPAGSDGRLFRDRIQACFEALDRFRPQLLFVSAGFDAHIEDEMAGLALSEDDYGWLTDRLVAIAERHGAGRIVSSLEGGYALPALGRSVVSHVDALIGGRTVFPISESA